MNCGYEIAFITARIIASLKLQKTLVSNVVGKSGSASSTSTCACINDAECGTFLKAMEDGIPVGTFARILNNLFA